MMGHMARASWSPAICPESSRESGPVSRVLPGLPTTGGELVCGNMGPRPLGLSPPSSLAGEGGAGGTPGSHSRWWNSCHHIRALSSSRRKGKESKGHPTDVSSGYLAIPAQQHFYFYPCHEDRYPPSVREAEPKWVLFREATSQQEMLRACPVRLQLLVHSKGHLRAQDLPANVFAVAASLPLVRSGFSGLGGRDSLWPRTLLRMRSFY